MTTEFDFEAHNPRLRYIVRQYQREAVRENYAARDAKAGGIWSMNPFLRFTRLAAAEIIAAADAEKARAEAFAASPRGRFVKAVGILAGHQEAASARAAYDRGFAGETINVREVGFAISCLLVVADRARSNTIANTVAFEGLRALADLLGEVS